MPNPGFHAADRRDRTSTARRLRAIRPEGCDARERTARWIRSALGAGLLDLPLPGQGATRERLAALAAYGFTDLDLARLAEAHTDALAILAELGYPPPGKGVWGVWAANPPTDPVTAASRANGWVLTGTKPWCSGAGSCDSALVTAQTPGGYRLFAVDLHDPRVQAVEGSWPGPAMLGSDSRSVSFDNAPVVPIGEPLEYLDRPGFWYGATGVAAVWFGGAQRIAQAFAVANARRPLHAHALAHAGQLDAALAAAWAVICRAGDVFDHPSRYGDDVKVAAMRARAVTEQAATEVILRTGRALGAAPLAMDAAHSRHVTDLSLYLRQSHAERDLEELGKASLEAAAFPWEGEVPL